MGLRNLPVTVEHFEIRLVVAGSLYLNAAIPALNPYVEPFITVMTPPVETEIIITVSGAMAGVTGGKLSRYSETVRIDILQYLSMPVHMTDIFCISETQILECKQIGTADNHIAVVHAALPAVYLVRMEILSPERGGQYQHKY